MHLFCALGSISGSLQSQYFGFSLCSQSDSHLLMQAFPLSTKAKFPNLRYPRTLRTHDRTPANQVLRLLARGFQNHCRRKGSASPTTQSAEGHKGTLYQKPPLTLSLETLRAPQLMQRIETNNPTTRLGGMIPFLFQPLFRALLCFSFFVVDFQTIHRLNFVLNKVGALLKLYYKIVLTSSSFLQV